MAQQIRAGKRPSVVVDQAKIRQAAAWFDECPGREIRVGLQLMAPQQRRTGAGGETQNKSG